MAFPTIISTLNTHSNISNKKGKGKTVISVHPRAIAMVQKNIFAC